MPRSRRRIRPSLASILPAVARTVSSVHFASALVPPQPISPRPPTYARRRRLGASPGQREVEVADTFIFLRFSPLIGGPAFLPLHVEVILAVEDACSEKTETIMDTVHVRKDSRLSSTPFLTDFSQLHRFDFLPVNPTDTSTLVRLVSLRGVPGRLRYRSYEGNSEVSRAMQQTESKDEGEKKEQDGRGLTILIPVGSLPRIDAGNDTTGDAVSTAIEFKDEYQDTLFQELRLLGGKNCLSFALDLLAELDASTGMKRTGLVRNIDIE